MTSITLEKTSTKLLDSSPNTPTEELLRIFRLQKENAQNIKNTTYKERIKKVKKIKDFVINNRKLIQDALYADLKKPPAETELSETYIVVKKCRQVATHLEDWMKPQIVDTPMTFLGSSASIIHEPMGTVLIISPWNYPFNLSIAPLVLAIAAGNTVMIKPSEYTPNTSRLIKEMIAGLFEENEVAVVEGDHTVGQALLNTKFDHIYFTGSPDVGKIVMRSAAQHLTSVTLELGGKSPTIVDETADLDQAARRIAWGKLLNSGQTCIAPDYLLVHKSKSQALVQKITQQIQKVFGNSPETIEESKDLCRIVNNRHFDRISKLLDDAIENGAKVEFGGLAKRETRYISPTLLTNIDLDSAIMQEEIFGPILPIIEYDRLEDVLEVINSREKPLSLYIFSKKRKHIDYILNHTSAGSTCVNHVLIQFAHPNLSFGGVNHSGMGRGHGKWGFEEFSNSRSLVRQFSPISAAKFTFPPYTTGVKRIINALIKWF